MFTISMILRLEQILLPDQGRVLELLELKDQILGWQLAQIVMVGMCI